MEENKRKSVGECKEFVQEKVGNEYCSFMAKFRDLPEKARMNAMVNDAERIAFYRHFYIIVVIIGDLDPWLWKWLYRYYLNEGIIEDYYLSMKAFESDSGLKVSDEEEEYDELEGFDEDMILDYVDCAQATAQCSGIA
jgi:hypothetical protein